ncbi:MAG: TIGR03862 family flavoprotein [Rhodoferax sp.]|nr:TIGR03862 family flavoprotein [Rhodoferax sp.]
MPTESPAGAHVAVAVIGGGPAGLMAAQQLSQHGLSVDLFDAMPSVGRKFLLAGKGGLNLTHSEPFADFVPRYGHRRPQLESMLQAFGAAEVREWAAGLGSPTFVGSSGRVFPQDMKSAPLLRAWLHRLRHPVAGVPVRFHTRHRWVGFGADGSAFLCHFDTPVGPVAYRADRVVMALGGASWSRLGSDGAWVPLLVAGGIEVVPLRPANCGFEVAGGWSDFFRDRFEGQPLKSVVVTLEDGQGGMVRRKGEFVVTRYGVEGSLIYAMSAPLRDRIAAIGSAAVTLDLRPDLEPPRVLAEVRHPRGARSLSSHLKSRLGLDGIRLALLQEHLGPEAMRDSDRLASAIKALPLTLDAARPMDEAISTAGGVRFESLDDGLMSRTRPGLFFAGEMLDWEAPTGGYLLTACLASGYRAAQGVLSHRRNSHPA